MFSFIKSTSANLWFSMMMLGGVVLGIISSILVLIGLRKDQREFLAPFILIMSLNIFLEISYFIVMTMIGSLKFDPVTSTLFTVDFFILCLNVCIVDRFNGAKNCKSWWILFADILLSLCHLTIPRVQRISMWKRFYYCKFSHTYTLSLLIKYLSH